MAMAHPWFLCWALMEGKPGWAGDRLENGTE